MRVYGRGWEMHLGDCLEVMQVLPEVDHVITDPPYGEHVHAKPWQSHALTNHGQHRPRSRHAGIDFASLSARLRSLCADFWAQLVRRWTVTFCDIEGGEVWRGEFLRVGLDYVRTCVWDKVDSAPQFTGDRPASAAELVCLAHSRGRKRWNGGGKRNVYRVAVNGERGGKPHPTQKPLDLMLALVADFTDPGETILDAFAGSGTTGVAALRLGRKFIGIEKDPKYFDLCCERLRAEERGHSLQAERAGQEVLFHDTVRR